MLQQQILDCLPKLRRFAYSLTKDMHDADDLVQVVVEKVLKNELPALQDFVPWIFRICKNAWIDELRSRQTRQSNVAIDPDSISNGEGEHTPESGAMSDDILRSIESLPESHRLVMSLVIVSGMSYQETAQTLDIPIGTVMSRVARARQKLMTIFRTS